MSANTAANLSNLPKLVAVHPLVLLSVVDHFNRVAQSSKNKRVVGVLLGSKVQGKLDVTNCYAIPFDEDPKQPNIWFVDHVYHETMFTMFKKVNAREKVLGWYTTGKHFKQHDIQINEVFKKYCPNPILLIVDVQHEFIIYTGISQYQKSFNLQSRNKKNSATLFLNFRNLGNKMINCIDKIKNAQKKVYIIIIFQRPFLRLSVCNLSKISYCNNKKDKLALPTESYCAVEEVSKNGEIIQNFIHLSSTVEAYEPEEIGVEHLLREIRDVSVNTLTNQVSDKIQALKGMNGKILQIKNYIEAVLSGKVQAKNDILFKVQEILNLLPNLNNPEIIKSFASKNNDMMFVLYVCSLSKSIISLHSLINNKLQNKEAELEKLKENEKKVDEKKDGAGEKKDEKKEEKKEEKK